MQEKREVSVEDYFRALQGSDIKLEYHFGEIVAMAGVQPNHAKIHSNTLGQLYACLKEKGCLIVVSDLLVKAGTCGNFYFPDLVIVCKKEEYEMAPSGLKALTNPEIIIEILSDTTESFDRTFKFDCYKTIPGFRKYVLVHTNKKKMEIVRRISDAEWLSHVYEGSDNEIDLEGCKLFLEDVYSRVEF